MPNDFLIDNSALTEILADNAACEDLAHKLTNSPIRLFISFHAYLESTGGSSFEHVHRRASNLMGLLANTTIENVCLTRSMIYCLEEEMRGNGLLLKVPIVEEQRTQEFYLRHILPDLFKHHQDRIAHTRSLDNESRQNLVDTDKLLRGEYKKISQNQI